MELIEKALAKARAQQEAAKQAPKSPTPAGSSLPGNQAASAGVEPTDLGGTDTPGRRAQAKLDAIRYVRTRVQGVEQGHWLANRLVAANATDKVADIFRILRTKVLIPMRENGWQTLAIVGATPAVGKTTIASNLAMSIALDANQSVLLVDADLRRPKVATYFGLSPEIGLGDVLAGTASLESALLNPGIERLVILPSMGSLQNSTELLSSLRMQELLPELRNRYASRVVIFDLPPLLATGDTLAFLHNFDCTLLVVENGRNTADELLEARRLLQGTNFLGWVLNKGDPGAVGGYYHYGATG